MNTLVYARGGNLEKKKMFITDGTWVPVHPARFLTQGSFMNKIFKA